MKPSTFIGLWASLSVATASPAWGCNDEQPTCAHHSVSDKKTSTIIYDTPVATEIASARMPDAAYSGYDLLKMELKDYLSLGDNWDGLESKAASAESVAMALQLVDRLPSGLPLPKPMLSTNGEVGLYWDVGAIYADIGFEEENILSIFLRDRRAEDRETFVELKLSGVQADQLKAILSPLATA